MKSNKAFLKTLFFFYLIPYLVSLLFTAIYCLGEVYFNRVLWLEEWMLIVPAYISEYTLTMMVYGFFGICAYYIFFGRLWQKIAVPAISVVCSLLLPFLRYPLRHVICGRFLNDLTMYDMYVDDVTAGYLFASYCLIAIVVILLERAYYAYILREKPQNDGRTFSLRHPIGMTMLLFFAGIFVWTLILYVLPGDFSLSSLGMLALELVIDVAGFWVATLAANAISAWQKRDVAAVPAIE